LQGSNEAEEKVERQKSNGFYYELVEGEAGVCFHWSIDSSGWSIRLNGKRCCLFVTSTKYGNLQF